MFTMFGYGDCGSVCNRTVLTLSSMGGYWQSVVNTGPGHPMASEHCRANGEVTGPDWLVDFYNGPMKQGNFQRLI